MALLPDRLAEEYRSRHVRPSVERSDGLDRSSVTGAGSMKAYVLEGPFSMTWVPSLHQTVFASAAPSWAMTMPAMVNKAIWSASDALSRITAATFSELERRARHADL